MLDDLIEIVGEVGDKLDVVMLPKVDGPWDIHYIDQLLAQLEARHGLKKPILVHAILETAEGVKNVEAIAAASPAPARHEPRPGGPRRLARHEDDARRRRAPRVQGASAIRPRAGARATAQQDLWHYTLARMVDACLANGLKAFYGPFGDFSDPLACEAQFRNAFLMGCAGAWSLHPSQIAIAKKVFAPDPAEVAFAQAHPRGDAGRRRRRDDRRQDAGRRNLEAGQGDRRSRAARRGRKTRRRRRLYGPRLTPRL